MCSFFLEDESIAHQRSNAYHIGQTVVMRKAQGSWDAEKGVK